jgi:hypothetical protein
MAPPLANIDPTPDFKVRAWWMDGRMNDGKNETTRVEWQVGRDEHARTHVGRGCCRVITNV